MDDARKATILEEILKWDGVPLREPLLEGGEDFTIDEYCKLHLKIFGYRLAPSTARDRLDVHVEEGYLCSEIRYDPTEEKNRRVYWMTETDGGKK